MTFVVNNNSDTNVILSIDRNNYLIKANDHNCILKTTEKCSTLSVRREKNIPAPSYKKMFLKDFLGILSLLFIKPLFYVLDVSSTHYLNTREECVTINILRTEKDSDQVVYDVIDLESAVPIFAKTIYHVENKAEISSVYDKSKRVYHSCLYIAMEFFFTLIGILITYPLLLAIYFATKSIIIKIVMAIVPFLMIGTVALIGILPLHFLFKISDKRFYRSMESDEIYRVLKNTSY